MAGGAHGALIAGVSGLAFIAGSICLSATARAATPASLAWEGGAPRSTTRTITMSVPLTWNGRVLGDVIVQAKPDGTVDRKSVV